MGFYNPGPTLGSHKDIDNTALLSKSTFAVAELI